MEEQKVPYQKQIFVCTHDAHGESNSCGDHNGVAVFKALRKVAKDQGQHPKFRVAQAKCLGQCSRGVNVMSYPDGQWFSGVGVEDVPELAKKVLLEENK